MRLNINLTSKSVITIIMTLILTGQGIAQNTPHNSPAELRGVIQPKLALLGLYDGPIDGIYGPMTRRAIIAFERRLRIEDDGFLNDNEMALLIEREESKRRFFPSLRGHWSGKLQCDSGLDWNAMMVVTYSNDREEYVVTYGQSDMQYPRLIEGVAVSPFGFYVPDRISFTGNDGSGYRVSYRGDINVAANSSGTKRSVTSIQAHGYRGSDNCDLVLVPTNQKWRLDALVNALPRNQLNPEVIAEQEAEANRIAQEAEADRIANAAETRRLAEAARLAALEEQGECQIFCV